MRSAAKLALMVVRHPRSWRPYTASATLTSTPIHGGPVIRRASPAVGVASSTGTITCPALGDALPVLPDQDVLPSPAALRPDRPATHPAPHPRSTLLDRPHRLDHTPPFPPFGDRGHPRHRRQTRIRRAGTHPHPGHYVCCSPGRCPLHQDGCCSATDTIPGGERHLSPPPVRVADSLTDSGQRLAVQLLLG